MKFKKTYRVFLPPISLLPPRRLRCRAVKSGRGVVSSSEFCVGRLRIDIDIRPQRVRKSTTRRIIPARHPTTTPKISPADRVCADKWPGVAPGFATDDEGESGRDDDVGSAPLATTNASITNILGFTPLATLIERECGCPGFSPPTLKNVSPTTAISVVPERVAINQLCLD